jgi:hypothetical protein
MQPTSIETDADPKAIEKVEKKLLWLVTCLPVILSVAKSCWERVFSRKEDWERRASLSIAIKE